ncbi:MAG: hypothetical protein EOO52_07095 [Gammaproteobacteria bacterium]|nr:MAG: hypothetical protein EOO52_07095 [Gammaproteobacteria bacterium]
MKNLFSLLMLVTALVMSSHSWSKELSPIEVVNKRMDAYNKNNFDGLISLYSENISIYTYPDSKLAEGKANLEAIFKPLFAEGKVKVKIIKQIENGSYVVNEEIVSYPNESKKYVSIYKVEKGLITEVRFVREEKI